MWSFLVSDPSSWVLWGCALLGMALYVLSVKSLGKYSLTHSCFLTGLVLLTPLSNNKNSETGQKTNNGKSNKKNSSQKTTSGSSSLLESMEFHQSTLQAGSIPLQALQQQQQQQGGVNNSSTTSNSTTSSNNNNNNNSQAQSRSPMLQFWKDMDALFCMMVACAVYFLVQEFVPSFTRSAVGMRLEKSLAWWFLGMTAARITFQSLYTVWTTPIQVSSAAAPLVRRQQQDNISSTNSSSSTLSWMIALASTSPRSVFHALVLAMSVTIYHGSSSSSSSLSKIAQEVAVRGELWKRLVVETMDTNDGDDENTTALLVIQSMILFAGTFAFVFVLAEPVQLLQTALWHTIYRQGTLKQQLLVPKTKQSTGFLRSINFWMARLAFWNLWIVPLVWMGAIYFCRPTRSDEEDHDATSSKNGHRHQLHLYMATLWVVSLILQMHSLLQDYLLGALLTCVHILRPQAQQPQEGTESSTSNDHRSPNNSLERNDSETLTWMSNLFASRSSKGLVARANQFLVVPSILLLLISAASLPGLNHTTILPVAYQVGTGNHIMDDPALMWWQELSDWNQNQFEQVLSKNSSPALSIVPRDLLQPVIFSPPDTDPSPPLIPLLKQLQEHAQESLEDPEIHRALTSSESSDAESSNPTIQAVYWNLLRIRFVLSKLVHHSILPQTIVAAIAWEMIGLFFVYWILSAFLSWKHSEFQEYSRHAQFLQKTLDKNKASESTDTQSSTVKQKES